jgi:hypothetical protein
MRKLLIGALACGLVAAYLVAPAAAKKKAQPQPVTFYLHGPFTVGELDYAETTSNELQGLPDGFQVMDATEPSDPAPDSMSILNYIQGPNRSCDGNALFPTWEGKVTGKVTGDIKIYLNSLVVPDTGVIVDVFADTTGGCTSTTTGSAEYIEPVASIRTTLSEYAGENEIVIKNVSFESTYSLVVMVSPDQMAVAGESKHDATSHGRILYDSADFASRIEFTCTPTSGKSCLPAS